MAERKMRKIKGLKVPIRYYDIERRIKKIAIFNNNTEGSDFQNFLKQTISSIVLSFEISLVYDNIEVKNDEVLSNAFGSKKINYISCGFFTFGKNADKESLTEEIERKVFEVVIDVHSKTAIEVIKDLIKEEAKKERLSVEELIVVYEPNVIKDQKLLDRIINLITLENSSISYHDGKLYPLYSWAFLVPWVSSRK